MPIASVSASQHARYRPADPCDASAADATYDVAAIAYALRLTGVLPHVAQLPEPFIIRDRPPSRMISDAPKAKQPVCADIDCTCTFAATQHVGKADGRTARLMPQHMFQAVPGQVNPVLGEKDLQFGEQPIQP